MLYVFMEGMIFRGGPRKKFRGSSLSIKNLKFQELNFDKCWGGGVSRKLYSIPFPHTNTCGSLRRIMFRQTVPRPFPCSC